MFPDSAVAGSRHHLLIEGYIPQDHTIPTYLTSLSTHNTTFSLFINEATQRTRNKCVLRKTCKIVGFYIIFLFKLSLIFFFLPSIGRNIKLLLDRKDSPYCFRLQKNRVYYVREDLAGRAGCFERHNLALLGVCFGKFTQSAKFKLHITALDYLAQYAKVNHVQRYTPLISVFQV